MFADLDEGEIRNLAAAFDEIAFGRGERIIEQGLSGDSMYVITSGSCELVRYVKESSRSSTIKAGDYFGHEVMIDHQKYLASVISNSTTTGWRIDRSTLMNVVPIHRLRAARLG